MKKLLVALMILVFSTPLSAGGPRERTWFCRQNGTVGNTAYMFISEPCTDTYPNHYDERQEAFSKDVKKLTKGTFEPMFEAKCREYYNPKQTEKHLRQEMKTS